MYDRWVRDSGETACIGKGHTYNHVYMYVLTVDVLLNAETKEAQVPHCKYFCCTFREVCTYTWFVSFLCEPFDAARI